MTDGEDVEKHNYAVGWGKHREEIEAKIGKLVTSCANEILGKLVEAEWDLIIGEYPHLEFSLKIKLRKEPFNEAYKIERKEKYAVKEQQDKPGPDKVGKVERIPGNPVPGAAVDGRDAPGADDSGGRVGVGSRKEVRTK